MISKNFYLFILIIGFTSCISITEEKGKVTSDALSNITFKQKAYDFGKIPMGKSVSKVFKFSNVGGNPLFIKEVNSSCECTVPEWTKEMIKSNESGEIKIVYDAKYPGRFNKTVTVIYNGKDSPEQLTIKGEVISSETAEETNIK